MTVTSGAAPASRCFHRHEREYRARRGGAKHPNFVLVSEPIGAATNAIVLNPGAANASYTSLLDGPNSQWIGPDVNDSYVQAGVYHYQLQFLLCCTNGAQLTGQFAADNEATMYLNGNYVASTPITGFSSWTPVVRQQRVRRRAEPFNVIDVYLTNFGSSFQPGFSPTALPRGIDQLRHPAPGQLSQQQNRRVRVGVEL